MRIGHPLSNTVVHAMSGGGSALGRCSRAWHSLLRDSRGRVQDRKMALSDSVTNPVRLTSWAEVADGYRKWELDLIELEGINHAKMDTATKTSALLRLIPIDLRNLAMSQAGLE